MIFAPNQRILCVRDDWKRARVLLVDPMQLVVLPTKGRIYTVRLFRLCDDGMAFLFLNEIRNPQDSLGSEWAFWADYFVPVKTVETDISVFKRLLQPAKEGA